MVIEAGDKTCEYQLCSVISHINDSSNGVGHLVTHTWTSKEYGTPDVPLPSEYVPPNSTDINEDGQWLLFNDFAVTPTMVDDVMKFAMPWRSPCVLLYRKVGMSLGSTAKTGTSTVVEPAVPPPGSSGDKKSSTSDGTVVNGQKQKSEQINYLFDYPSLSHNYSAHKSSFVKVPPTALPSKGDLVAIDAEFVALSEEEAEIRADGRRVVVQDSRLSLARVSVLNDAGTTFIDDYIVTPEPVVDYLTRFSGLVPGDLDPSVSSHHLLPLKVVYSKLRHLVDRGCLFVGHGLTKDFRIINLYVPPEQIIDTVELFHRPHQRKISLRFLAGFLLGMDIQSETHDSIEDAKTALLVYKKYLQLTADKKFEQTLTEIYNIGHQTGWKAVS
jgi:PAB-dependent poly(A)-specific ribonuclease subunit 2